MSITDFAIFPVYHHEAALSLLLICIVERCYTNKGDLINLSSISMVKFDNNNNNNNNNKSVNIVIHIKIS